MSTVSVKHYAAPPVDLREILRYAGVRGDAPQVEALLSDCVEELLPRLTYGVCFCELPIRIEPEGVDLGAIRLASQQLKRHLEGCERAVLFAATVGMAPDRAIARYRLISPAKALMMQAVGTERIEALCDRFCAEYEGQDLRVTSRFSPGYGDLALETQRDWIGLLDGPRRIGLTLNESCLMSPSKSVTAIIGVGNRARSDESERK